jgi:hypothetical protein
MKRSYADSFEPKSKIDENTLKSNLKRSINAIEEELDRLQLE